MSGTTLSITKSFLKQCFACRIRSFSTHNLGISLRKLCDSKYPQLHNLSFKMSSFTKDKVLRLTDYDCIGFDLDNTICEYNISLSVEMEYKILSSFLVKEKGYDPNYLLKDIDYNSKDFLQKGLILDFARGNILKIAGNGTICKASHGTRFMTEKEIVGVYGKDKKWETTSEFCTNMIEGWNGPSSERMRALLDYFDMPASLAFARIVDYLDVNTDRSANLRVYNVWPDVLAGLQGMYNRAHFSEGTGGFFQEVKSNPHKFIKKCNPVVLNWLKTIKKSKITFLITGSNCDFASLTAKTCLGENWRTLFDVIVCFARKPGFFCGCRPFVELNGFKETDPIDENDLKLGHMYSQGNWQELYRLFERNLNKKDPRCLYFGDNLIQDVYTPSEFTKCETVAVVEELIAESDGNPSCDNSSQLLELLSSHSWGSYFYDKKENLGTVWGDVIERHSKMCIPSLSFLAQHSINHEFTTFFKDSKEGYYPCSPILGETINSARN